MTSVYSFDPNPNRPQMKMISLVGEGKRVLDVGCSDGWLSQRMSENGCDVVGIEVDRESAQRAAKYCTNVISQDVETLVDLPYPREHFDVILFGDVLEHLRDPLGTLRKLKGWLKEGGQVICSIPNVAHLYVRLKLLFGRWDYENSGLMDRTHLRFFTMNTAIKLIEDAGLSIE